MFFSEKLNFLFELTGTEGKALAAALHVTPPQISKMRKGVRGRPRSRESTAVMARFFARYCGDKTKKEALADVMQAPEARFVQDETVLADMLQAWFWEAPAPQAPNAKAATAFLDRLSFPSGADAAAQADVMKPLNFTGDGAFSVFFGVEGRQMASLTLWQYLLKKGGAYEICLLSDEDNGWVVNDTAFSNKYYDLMLRLTRQGCFFRRIIGQLTTVEQAFFSLNRWFPLYLTGKASSYYCKRLRDNLNRVTVFVVSGTAAVFSFSSGSMPLRDSVTFFTTEPKTVASMMALHNAYLSMCEPAMNTYGADTAEEQMHNRLIEYEGYKTACWQASGALSFITLPWEIAVSLRAERSARSKDVFLSAFAKRYKLFSANLERHDFFDLIRLEDADSIMAGKVKIPAASIIGDRPQCYTPTGYLQHLKRVVHLLKQRQHYHVIVQGVGDNDEPIIYVKDGEAALLTRSLTPFVMFDVTEHNLINAFAEYLRRQVPDNVHDAAYRNTVMMQLQALIDEIERRMPGREAARAD